MERGFYTYQFDYPVELDGFGVVQFCGKSKQECENLFRDFCKENHIEVKEYTCQNVYNPYDAAEYGEKYRGNK